MALTFYEFKQNSKIIIINQKCQKSFGERNEILILKKGQNSSKETLPYVNMYMWDHSKPVSAKFI